MMRGMVRPSLLAGRTLGFAVLIGLGLAGSACEQRQAPAARDNLLVLDLGGDHPSLSADLRRTAPRADGPGPDAPGPEALPDPNPAPGPGADPRPELDPAPTPTPKTTPKPEFTVVRLAAGQTLYNLCQVHLGSGARWQEVARFNGWSRGKAEHLPAGQAVKLPRR
jgi:hypothetical protein